MVDKSVFHYIIAHIIHLGFKSCSISKSAECDRAFKSVSLALYSAIN